MKASKIILNFGLIIFIGILSIISVNAAPITTLRTFDNVNELTDVFNPDNTPVFTNVASGGLGNSGAINVPIGSNDIWTTKQGYSVAGAGDIYTFSAFFKIKQNSGYGGLGFSNVNTNTTDSYGSPLKGVGVYFHGGGGAFVNNRTGTIVSWYSQKGDLILGNWYQMIFKVTAQGSNTFDLKLQIWNSDSNGNVGTLFTEQNLNGVVNSEIGSANLIYGYFSAAGSRMEKIDNFLMSLDGGSSFIEAGLPVVLTNSVTNVLTNSAVVSGNAVNDQGASVTAKGVCWSTTTSPTTSNNCTNVGTGIGSFNSNVNNLLPGTTYYVRSYATNSNGTSYGSEKTFTTENSPTPTPSLTLIPTTVVTTTILPTPDSTNVVVGQTNTDILTLKPTIQGVNTEASKLVVDADPDQTYSINPGNNGSWSVDVTKDLKTGSHHVLVYNSAGSVLSETTFNISNHLVETGEYVLISMIFGIVIITAILGINFSKREKVRA